MRHAARLDGWIVVAVLVGTVAPLLTHAYWASGVVLGVLLMGAYPQSYESTGRGLRIRAGLTQRLVPYEAITYIGPASGSRPNPALARAAVKIRWGRGAEVVITPADPNAFFADMAARAPHLGWQGPSLVAAC